MVKSQQSPLTMPACHGASITAGGRPVNDPRYDAKTWAVGVIFLVLAGMIGYMLPQQMASTNLPQSPSPQNSQAASGPLPNSNPQGHSRATRRQAPTSPSENDLHAAARRQIPDNEFGKMVRFGQAVFEDTQHNAKAFTVIRCAARTAISTAAGWRIPPRCGRLTSPFRHIVRRTAT